MRILWKPARQYKPWEQAGEISNEEVSAAKRNYRRFVLSSGFSLYSHKFPVSNYARFFRSGRYTAPKLPSEIVELPYRLTDHGHYFKNPDTKEIILVSNTYFLDEGDSEFMEDLSGSGVSWIAENSNMSWYVPESTNPLYIGMHETLSRLVNDGIIIPKVYYEDMTCMGTGSYHICPTLEVV